MGGTTAKVSIVRDGEIDIADGYWIGGEEHGYPLQLPVVDVVEIGAGGGSIAHVDELGALKIGPESAGAVPGPVGYGKGGTKPTVTDANLILGRLNPAYFLGGEIALSVERSEDAIRRRRRRAARPRRRARRVRDRQDRRHLHGASRAPDDGAEGPRSA